MDCDHSFSGNIIHKFANLLLIVKVQIIQLVLWQFKTVKQYTWFKTRPTSTPIRHLANVPLIKEPKKSQYHDWFRENQYTFLKPLKKELRLSNIKSCICVVNVQYREDFRFCFWTLHTYYLYEKFMIFI